MARAADRFELRRLTPTEWLIQDRSIPPTNPRHDVACVEEVTAGAFEVVWLRNLGLPDRYSALDEVLRDIASTLLASSKPIPIPHFRPAPTSAPRAG